MLRRKKFKDGRKYSCKRQCQQKSSKDIYDYIIIGAGTAGGVLAKKLTDNYVTSVLVLDPGTNLTEELSCPDITVEIEKSSQNKYSYNILSTQEPLTQQSSIPGVPDKVVQRQLDLLGGRVYGGSSTHNYTASFRGSPELYNRWVVASGSEQWSYPSLLPLFKENEHYTGDTQSPDQRG